MSLGSAGPPPSRAGPAPRALPSADDIDSVGSSDSLEDEQPSSRSHPVADPWTTGGDTYRQETPVVVRPPPPQRHSSSRSTEHSNGFQVVTNPAVQRPAARSEGPSTDSAVNGSRSNGTLQYHSNCTGESSRVISQQLAGVLDFTEPRHQGDNRNLSKSSRGGNGSLTESNRGSVSVTGVADGKAKLNEAEEQREDDAGQPMSVTVSHCQ